MTQNPGTEGLPARSAAEAQIYMDLHPCGGCGAPLARGAQELRGGGAGGLVSVYSGDCPGCGLGWSLAFRLPSPPPPAGRIGGGEPSAIIDPGEWLYLSDLMAGFAAGPAPGPGGRVRLSLAADALDETLKFIGPGLDRVPAEAISSSWGLAVLSCCPGRFRRQDLLGRSQLYRAGAAQGMRRSREIAG